MLVCQTQHSTRLYIQLACLIEDETLEFKKKKDLTARSLCSLKTPRTQRNRIIFETQRAENSKAIIVKILSCRQALFLLRIVRSDS